MTHQEFTDKIRDLISKNKIKKAIDQLKILFENSPKLNKVLAQSARFTDIMDQIHSGVADPRDASIRQNQIVMSLLDLMGEVGEKSKDPELKEEIEKAISIVNSKNVVVGDISAAGDVKIGDTTVHTESKMSKGLRLFLFVFVPLLAIGGTYFWYQNQQSKKPLNLKVLVENTTPNPELEDPEGTLTLTYGGSPMTKTGVSSEALFENIPSNYRDEIFRLKYEAYGYEGIDTSFKFSKSVSLPVRRTNELGVINGYVYAEGTDPLETIQGVKVSTSCCEALTDASGKFSLKIPFEYQLKKQRLEFFKEGFHQKSTTEPVIAGIDIQTYLVKK